MTQLALCESGRQVHSIFSVLATSSRLCNRQSTRESLSKFLIALVIKNLFTHVIYFNYFIFSRDLQFYAKLIYIKLIYIKIYYFIITQRLMIQL